LVSDDEFCEFFRQEIAPLVAFVCRAGFNREQARDAAQEAMTRAYLEWSQLKQPRAWVRVVAHRVAMAEVVRSKDGLRRAVSGGWAPSIHYDPDTAILGEEHEHLLRDLSTLSEQRRLVMTWHLDGFDHIEIAEQLECPPATVRSNLRHARNALKALFNARKSGEEACR
jgi:RNA polymerase sigma-70 factor (ECF subfamily)